MSVRCNVTERSVYAMTGDNVLFNYGHIGDFITDAPPSVGDTMVYGGAAFRVVDRQWIHAMHGSADWPKNETEPKVGPILDLIVESTPGIYANEAPL